MAVDDFAAVRERVDPVALVEGLTEARVKHRSPGDVRLAPCPFCGSKTGFSVNPQTKTYCCHHAGCGAQGDVFTFVQKVRGFAGPREALEFLAERVGHTLERPSAAGGVSRPAALELGQEMKRAAVEYYVGRLWACRDEPLVYRKGGTEHTTTVLGYQTEMRAHSEGVLKYMRVGWADGGLLNHLRLRYRDRPEAERKLAFAAFMASGLVRKTEAGEFRDLFRPGGYVYPVLDAGRVVTFTAKYPDDGIADYQVPRTETIDGDEVSLWGSPYYFLNMDALDADDLVLVEGENDLLSVMDLGRHAAVAGLRGTPKREQLAALAERRRGRRTCLCFDADEAGRDVTRKVAEALAGPEFDLRVVSWEPREGVKDIDDLLRSVGREPAAPLFAGLLNRARPAVERLLEELRAAPPETKSDLAERFARIVLKNPPIEQAALRKRMAEILDVGARTVQQVIARAREGLTPSHLESYSPAQPAIPVMGDSYCRWTAEGLQKIEYHELDGQTVESAKRVSNYVIRIERKAQVIDDLLEHNEFECRLIVQGMPLDAPGRPIRLDAATFGCNQRLAQSIAAAGHGDLTCSMADIDFVRMVSSVLFHESGVASVKVVRYVGNASASGEALGYVTPSVVVRDGEILTADDAEKRFGFRCELPPGAFKSVGHLDLAIISDDEFRLACRSVLDDLLAFKGPGIGRACIGHTFLAPVIGRLTGFKPYALALVGGTGVGKTTLAAYFQSFFGPTFGDLDLESWTGTPKAVELAGHVYKDALYVVDDFKLAHFGPGALRDAMRVLQGYADGAGRNRLTRTSEMRKTAFIRGLLMITGEDLPEGESSNLARIVPLDVPETPLTPESVARKRRCDEARRLYAGVMARYIAWTQRIQDAALRDKVARHFEVLATDSAIERVPADNKPRLVQNLALNCFGFAMWAEFMCESGLLDEPAARRMVQEHFEFLKAAFAGHVEAVNDERPFVLFLRDLRSMVASEVVRLDPVTRKPDGGFLTEKETGDARRPLVGYRDLEHVYLLDGPAFKEVGEYRARGRINAGEFSKRAVMRQLLDEGVIVTNPKETGTHDEKKHLIYVNGGRTQVVKIPRALLEDVGG